VAVVAEQLGPPGAEGTTPADELGIVGVLDGQEEALQEALGVAEAGRAVEGPQLFFRAVEVGQGRVLPVDGPQHLCLPGGQVFLVFEQGSCGDFAAADLLFDPPGLAHPVVGVLDDVE